MPDASQSSTLYGGHGRERSGGRDEGQKRLAKAKGRQQVGSNYGLGELVWETLSALSEWKVVGMGRGSDHCRPEVGKLAERLQELSSRRLARCIMDLLTLPRTGLRNQQICFTTSELLTSNDWLCSGPWSSVSSRCAKDSSGREAIPYVFSIFSPGSGERMLLTIYQDSTAARRARGNM